MKYKLNAFMAILIIIAFVMVGCKAETPKPATTETAEKPTAGEAEVVSSKEMPKGIVPVEDWAEHYPEVVATFMKNSEMKATTYGGSEPHNYLEKYPYLKKFYEGYVFAEQYDRARGHVFALDDVVNTARPKKGASCLDCKVSEYAQALEKDKTVAMANFEQFVADNVTVGFTCYDCHGEEPGVVHLNRAHLITAMEENDYSEMFTDRQLSCAQCHVDYYMTMEENLTTLPWGAELGAETAFADHEADEFFDWEHPTTGAKLIKAQHPETETFEGSIHDKAGLDCISCHMPVIEVDGEKIKSHHWTSPLFTVKESCFKCHSDLDEEGIVKLAESIQKPIVDKTEEVALELEAYINKLAEKKAAGAINEEDLAKCQAIHREAQFYWDYVFVENGEGFHNNKKQEGYLVHAEELINQGLALLGD